MELTPLRYFVAIAKTGHLTRASKHLGVTQPALSAMLKKLESNLGTSLLTRTGRGVELTEAGRVFLTHAEAAVRSADQGQVAIRELLGLERGTIRIGGGATAVSYVLPPVVSVMRKQHPGLRFFVREAGSNQVAASVASGELDLGLVTLPITLADAENLVRLPLMEDEMRLIVPAGDALAKRPSFTWREIARMPIVGFEAGSAVRDVIDRAAADAAVRLDYVMEVRSIEGIMQMVRAGIGGGFVSKFALAADSGFASGIACKEGSLTRQLAIVKRRDRDLSAAAAACERALLEAARTLARH
jgi:DNA-binding transcriptional LysR family regulator